MIVGLCDVHFVLGEGMSYQYVSQVKLRLNLTFIIWYLLPQEEGSYNVTFHKEYKGSK
jgi:hypothetical protein